MCVSLYPLSFEYLNQIAVAKRRVTSYVETYLLPGSNSRNSLARSGSVDTSLLVSSKAALQVERDFEFKRLTELDAEKLAATGKGIKSMITKQQCIEELENCISQNESNHGLPIGWKTFKKFDLCAHISRTRQARSVGLMQPRLPTAEGLAQQPSMTIITTDRLATITDEPFINPARCVGMTDDTVEGFTVSVFCKKWINTNTQSFEGESPDFGTSARAPIQGRTEPNALAGLESPSLASSDILS